MRSLRKNRQRKSTKRNYRKRTKSRSYKKRRYSRRRNMRGGSLQADYIDMFGTDQLPDGRPLEDLRNYTGDLSIEQIEQIKAYLIQNLKTGRCIDNRMYTIALATIIINQCTTLNDIADRIDKVLCPK